MNIEINTANDEFFSLSKIKVAKFGEQYVACDGERSIIGKTAEEAFKALELLQPDDIVQINPEPSDAAPLENSRDGHPFDPFGGTSWAGKKQGFN